MNRVQDLIDNAIAAAAAGEIDDAVEATITAGELIDELAIALSRIQRILAQQRTVDLVAGKPNKRLNAAQDIAQNALGKVDQVAAASLRELDEMILDARFSNDELKSGG